MIFIRSMGAWYRRKNVARDYKPDRRKRDFPKRDSYIPSPRLSNGLHTLSFKVSDTLGNSSEVTIAFVVKEEQTKHILSPLKKNRRPKKRQSRVKNQNGNVVHRIETYPNLCLLTLRQKKSGSYGKRPRINPFPLTWNLQDNNGTRVSGRSILLQGVISKHLTGQSLQLAKKIVVITQYSPAILCCIIYM